MGLWQRLKNGFSRREEQTSSQSGAAHAGEAPGALHPGRRRLKEAFTSHWDLDYLPRDALDELQRDERRDG